MASTLLISCYIKYIYRVKNRDRTDQIARKIHLVSKSKKNTYSMAFKKLSIDVKNDEISGSPRGRWNNFKFSNRKMHIVTHH